MSVQELPVLLHSISDILFPAELGKAKIEINSVGAGGDTPLHVLTWQSNPEGVELLLGAGAIVDAVGEMGQTALHVAISQSNERIVSLLLASGANPDIQSDFGVSARELALQSTDNIAALFTGNN